MTAAAPRPPKVQPEKGLVLFSGGQDSATCLAWALARFAEVETIGFDYGQRHRVELDCRVAVIARLRREFPDWSGRLGEDHLVDCGVLGRISETALTRDTAIAFDAERAAQHLCPRPQPDVLCAGGGDRLSARRCAISSAACARPIIRAIPTAATTR